MFDVMFFITTAHSPTSLSTLILALHRKFHCTDQPHVGLRIPSSIYIRGRLPITVPLSDDLFQFVVTMLSFKISFRHPRRLAFAFRQFPGAAGHHASPARPPESRWP
jgi:hypothetical protein